MISVFAQSAGIDCPHSLIVLRPSQPDQSCFVVLCEGIKNWDSWQVASLGEPFFCHVSMNLFSWSCVTSLLTCCNVSFAIGFSRGLWCSILLS